ncbi:hypothetical protein CF326_g1709 [Tilletia indica]|nr:hypothetical protein CF326_g1709 [Tilletia indica]
MSSTTTPRSWSIPPLTGAPDEFTAGEDTIHGAYLNSGRLSEGLARLHGTSSLFKQTVARNDKISAGSTDTITRVLTATREDVKQHLLSVQGKFETECNDLRIRLDQEFNQAHASLKARMENELKFVDTAIEHKLENTITTVDATLRDAATSSHDALLEVLETLNACGAFLQRDINNMESDYMRSLARNVMGSTWTSAV